MVLPRANGRVSKSLSVTGPDAVNPFTQGTGYATNDTKSTVDIGGQPGTLYYATDERHGRLYWTLPDGTHWYVESNGMTPTQIATAATSIIIIQQEVTADAIPTGLTDSLAPQALPPALKAGLEAYFSFKSPGPQHQPWNCASPQPRSPQRPLASAPDPSRSTTRRAGCADLIPTTQAGLGLLVPTSRCPGVADRQGHPSPGHRISSIHEEDQHQRSPAAAVAPFEDWTERRADRVRLSNRPFAITILIRSDRIPATRRSHSFSPDAEPKPIATGVHQPLPLLAVDLLWRAETLT